MSESEKQKRLTELEKQIAKWRKSMERQAVELRKILDSGAYKEAGYATFEDFVRAWTQGNEPLTQLMIEKVNERSHSE